ARGHRALLAAGSGRLAPPVGGAGEDPGTPRRRTWRRGGTGRLTMLRITRRNFTVLAAAALLTRHASGQGSAASSPITRAIPSTGERIPVVGLGTASVFDSDDERTRLAAAAVIQALVGAGGRVIDTASSYGDAEVVVGDAVAARVCATRSSWPPSSRCPTRRN